MDSRRVNRGWNASASESETIHMLILLCLLCWLEEITWHIPKLPGMKSRNAFPIYTYQLWWIKRHYLLPGIPLSVEMPAPVITIRHLAAFTRDCRRLISSPSAGLQLGTNWEQATTDICRFNCNTVSNMTNARYTLCLHYAAKSIPVILVRYI